MLQGKLFRVERELYKFKGREIVLMQMPKDLREPPAKELGVVYKLKADRDGNGPIIPVVHEDTSCSLKKPKIFFDQYFKLNPELW